jgi:transposase
METSAPDFPATYVGLDVTKDLLDYTVDGIDSRQVPNNPEGHARLLADLQTLQQPRVVCAATGTHECAVCTALLTAGIEVGAVNPDRVRAYAHSEGRLNEFDAIDCRLLRQYGLEDQSRLIVPADPMARDLGELIAFRRELVAEVATLRAQLERANPVLHQLLKSRVKFCLGAVDEVDAVILDKVRVQ